MVFKCTRCKHLNRFLSCEPAFRQVSRSVVKGWSHSSVFLWAGMIIWVNMIQSCSSTLEMSDRPNSFVRIKDLVFNWQSASCKKRLYVPHTFAPSLGKEIAKLETGIWSSLPTCCSGTIRLPVLIPFDVSHFFLDPYQLEPHKAVAEVSKIGNL